MEPLLEKITSIIARHYDMNVDNLKPDTLLEELPGDSLMAVEVMIILEEELEIAVDDEDWYDARTVNDLFVALKEKEPA